MAVGWALLLRSSHTVIVLPLIKESGAHLETSPLESIAEVLLASVGRCVHDLKEEGSTGERNLS